MSNTVLSDSVVHEAIDERQHVRTRIPAKAQLIGSSGTPIYCDVQDISLGGIGLVCADQLTIGSLYEIDIKLEMSRVDLNFKAKVKIVKQDGDQLGTQFVDLDPKKADILRYIISSYMSGEVADINGLFNVMQRENYIKERKQKYDNSRSPMQRFRAGLGTLLFVLVGLLALLYIMYKAYGLFLRIPAAQATVTASAYVISMPENGNISFLIPPGQTDVTAGQPVASISTQLSTSLTSPADVAALMDIAPGDVEALLGRANIETVISSPCDCTVFYPGTQFDGFGYKGDSLVHLLPQNKPMLVTASVPFSKLEKLPRTRQVTLEVYGSDRVIDGRIIGATVNEQNQMVVLDIEPDVALSSDDYQKPVWVEFHLGLPGMYGQFDLEHVL